MRNIADYEEKYIVDKFEAKQVIFRRKKVMELLEQNPHKNILEVGCGLKPLFTDVEEFDTMTIVEPGEKFYENALLCAERDERQIHCILGFLETKVEEIKKLDISYDYIVISGLLHEIESPQTMLRAVYELAREDTILHINVPNANSIHRLIDKEMRADMDVHDLSEKAVEYQIQRVYDADSLKTEVEKGGFKVIESGTYFPKFFTHAQMQACLDNGIIDDEILGGGIYNLSKYIPDLGSELYVQCKKE